MELKVGDFVQWNSSGGTARGQISRIVREGTVAVPGSSFKIRATPEDPAVLIALYRPNANEGGYSRQDVTVGHKMSTLKKIEPLNKAATTLSDGQAPETPQPEIGARDAIVLDTLRPFSDLTDEQWHLLEEEVRKGGGISEVSGTVWYALEKARQTFGNRSAAGAYAANVRWSRNRGGDRAMDSQTGGGGGMTGTPPKLSEADYQPAELSYDGIRSALVARGDKDSEERLARLEDTSVVGVSGKTYRAFDFVPENDQHPNKYDERGVVSISNPANNAINAHNSQVVTNNNVALVNAAGAKRTPRLLASGGFNHARGMEHHGTVRIADIRPGMTVPGRTDFAGGRNAPLRTIVTPPGVVTGVKFSGNKAAITISQGGKSRTVTYDARDIDLMDLPGPNPMTLISA